MSLSITLSEHSGCFHDLAVVNNAAMNIEVQVSLLFFVCVAPGYFYLFMFASFKKFIYFYFLF